MRTVRSFHKNDAVLYNYLAYEFIRVPPLHSFSVACVYTLNFHIYSPSTATMCLNQKKTSVKFRKEKKKSWGFFVLSSLVRLWLTFTSLVNTHISNVIWYIIHAIRLGVGSLLFWVQSHWQDTIHPIISFTLTGQAASPHCPFVSLNTAFTVWDFNFISVRHTYMLMWFPYIPHKYWLMGLSALDMIWCFNIA